MDWSFPGRLYDKITKLMALPLSSITVLLVLFYYNFLSKFFSYRESNHSFTHSTSTDGLLQTKAVFDNGKYTGFGTAV